jgi:hypothetical protein
VTGSALALRGHSFFHQQDIMPMLYKGSKYYLVDEAGQLRFNEAGMKLYSDYFSAAGIAINDIKTLDDYLQARRQAGEQLFNQPRSANTQTSRNTLRYQTAWKAFLDSKITLLNNPPKPD